jgi:cyclic pyranopterin monophosphate synthase
MTENLTHLDKSGRAKMVDVTSKSGSERMAVARGTVLMKPQTLNLILEGNVHKGDVLTVAEIAGIMAAKKTSELIPLCHPLPINHVEVACTLNRSKSRVDIEAKVSYQGRTGVEMEALVAVTIAGLTIYDMAKAVDRGMRLSDVRLVAKTGGKSGDYFNDD